MLGYAGKETYAAAIQAAKQLENWKQKKKINSKIIIINNTQTFMLSY